jgi:hypothetical protein
MFAVDHVLVSEELLDAPFCCNLSACLGGCCVQGDSGAPLEAEERAELEEILPVVRKYLRPEALEVIEEKGVWEEISTGQFATTCVGGAECVFVTYEGPVAKCSIQRAYQEGRVGFPKPISCHLFPVRVENFGDLDALNYERIGMCDAAVRKGRRQGIPLHQFLREPLIRKYGEAWYDKFEDVCEERKSARPGTGA